MVGQTIDPIEPIITDDKILRAPSAIHPTWVQIDESKIIERLKASNETAWTKGVGLAAIQIGLPWRVAWFVDEGEEFVLVNPIITEATNPIIVPKEGCLSMPNVWTPTKRFNKITVRTMGREGDKTLEFTGFRAIVVQHEIDHMNGVLNIDRRYIPEQKVGRNDPCPCGSGTKYKKCCIDKLVQSKTKETKDEQKTNST